MVLAVNETLVARGKAAGLITVQPKNGLSVGENTQSAVGNYAPPHRLSGSVTGVSVGTGGDE